MVSSAATRERDKFHINKHLPKNLTLKDVTDYCVLGIWSKK